MSRWKDDPEYREIHKQGHARYRKSNPRKFKGYRLRWRFGIGIEEYDALLLKQGGVCAICGNAETQRTRSGQPKELSVDHCHTTGAIRGLLCAACNTTLGRMKDDSSLLRKAADYIDKHSTQNTQNNG